MGNAIRCTGGNPWGFQFYFFLQGSAACSRERDNAPELAISGYCSFIVFGLSERTFTVKTSCRNMPGNCSMLSFK